MVNDVLNITFCGRKVYWHGIVRTFDVLDYMKMAVLDMKVDADDCLDFQLVQQIKKKSSVQDVV